MQIDHPRPRVYSRFGSLWAGADDDFRTATEAGARGV